jgi:hypothetical protein
MDNVPPHHDSRQKKNPTKILGEEKFTNTENQKHPPIFSITPLFNLLALCNKLNPKSVLMECMFFSPQFFCINIYLFTFVFKICLFILVPVMCTLFPKRGNAIFEIE